MRGLAGIDSRDSSSASVEKNDNGDECVGEFDAVHLVRGEPLLFMVRTRRFHDGELSGGSA